MTAMTDSTPVRYWVREHGVRVRSGPGLRQPILTQLARGQAVEAAGDRTISADGYHWLPIRQGEATAFIARELLAESYVRPDPVGTVPVAPELVQAVQGTPLAGHTRALMAIALCESGGRTARDNGGELVHRFEPHQWDRLFRPTLGEPPATWTAEKCHVTSWGVGQIMGWSHATFGCADARTFRDWLQADITHEYEALVRFCLAKTGVAAAIQTESWEQLWLLYNGGHPQWLPNFQGALQRVTAAAPAPQEAPASPAVPPVSVARETPEPAVAASPLVSEEAASPAAAPVPEPPAAAPVPATPPADGLTRRVATVVEPTLRGLRYEGGRLLRRAFMLVTVVFTLWQTDVITPGQVVSLLEEAVTPLVTDGTASVEGRLDQSLDRLETRLAELEQEVQASALEPAMVVPTPTLGPTSPATVATGGSTDGVGADDAPMPTPTPAPTSPPMPEAACVPRQTVSTARYRVRVAPDRQAATVSTMDPGSSVCVQESRNGWNRLQAPEGWMVDEGLMPLPVAG